MDPIDVQRIVYALPTWLQEAMVKDPRIMVAGGFPRAIVAGETPKDIDVWTPADFNIAGFLKEKYGPHWVTLVNGTPNSWTTRDPVPVSFVFKKGKRFTMLCDCMQSFDFSVCQAGVCWGLSGWFGLAGSRFYRDLAARRLVIGEELSDPLSTMSRVLRYVGRGYHLDHESAVRLMLAVKKLDDWVIEDEWSNY